MSGTAPATPALSHGSSSRSRATTALQRSQIEREQQQQQSRTISLGLGTHRETDEQHTGRDRDRDTAATGGTNTVTQTAQQDVDVDTDTSVAASPPSPTTTASRLTLSLQSLALAATGQTADATITNSASSSSTGGAGSSSNSDLSLASSSFSSLSSSLNSSNIAPSVLSDQLLSLYEQTLQKLVVLRSTERTLSSQSGQLLKALQSEEGLVNTLNSTLKRIRHEHKKLLSRITAPRWEVKHHYHMTCMEHSLGHRQPHVMDVAEMLPGHLRLYAIARCHALIKRSFTSSTARAKQERNSAADQIKEGYRQLRETRAEMRDTTKLLEAMNAKTHLLYTQQDRDRLDHIIRKHRKQLASLSVSAPAQQALKGITPSSAHRFKSNVVSLSSPTNASAIRLRYLKSLNMAPKPYEARGETAEASVREEKKRVMESYNNDWKQMMHLFHKLEQQKKRREDAQKLYDEGNGDTISPPSSRFSNSKESSPLAAAVAASTTPSPPPAATPLAAVNAVSVDDEELDRESLSPDAVTDVEGEFRIVQSYRKRMGLQTLPSPLTFDNTEEGLRDIQDPNDMQMIGGSTTENKEDEREKQIQGILQLSEEIINEPTSPVNLPGTDSPGSPKSPASPPEGIPARRSSSSPHTGTGSKSPTPTSPGSA